MKSRVWADIDLSSIEYNFQYFRTRVKVNDIMAVVKANAYGHGAIQVARRLQGLADCFGVANVREGVQLRQVGIDLPIVVLGGSLDEEIVQAVEEDIILSVSTVRQAKIVDRVARECGKHISIYLAINTGFNRLGMDLDENVYENVRQISSLSYAKLTGVFTHANKPDTCQKVETYRQNESLVSLVRTIISTGANIQELSTCATLSCLDEDLVVGNMVRIGLGLYGYGQTGLVPSMSVYSRVVHIRYVRHGESVGYAPCFKASRDMVVAVLSIGYADGYSLGLESVGYVLVGDKLAKVIGKICMDMCMIDITDIVGVKVGDIATMWGTQPRLDAMTAHSSTSVYEMLSTVGKRVEKRYIG